MLPFYPITRSKISSKRQTVVGDECVQAGARLGAVVMGADFPLCELSDNRLQGPLGTLQSRQASLQES